MHEPPCHIGPTKASKRLHTAQLSYLSDPSSAAAQLASKIVALIPLRMTEQRDLEFLGHDSPQFDAEKAAQVAELMRCYFPVERIRTLKGV